MRVKAAILASTNEKFLVDDVELGEPRAGEVLVKIRAVGVCHSDWHLATGATTHPLPVVPGHEGAGVVEAVGPGVADLAPGDHVILNWAPACGSCFYCVRDRASLCETYTDAIWSGRMLDGTTRLKWRGRDLFSYCGLAALAERAVVPRQSCVKIRKDVSLEAAAIVGCAVATGVGAALFTAKVQPGESAVVLGLGGVGLSIVQGLRLAGATPILGIDTNVKKIWIGQHFGADKVVLADDDLLKFVHAHTASRGADHVFEAVGVPSLQERSLALTRPGGTLTLASLAPMGSATNFPAAVLARQEKTIKGSYYGSVNPLRDFPRFIDLYAGKKLNLDDMITRRYPLEQVNEAYADMLTGDLARGMITFP
ncbi:MAG TPA: Zn-dependent alcohol dehydrogenase [Tepidisphaeraceae bacterium]|jgi:Zn-dependent alcohol dehydrogenase